MEKFEVDLDAESIWFGEAWRTREDLANEIKTKLEAGDYQIAQPSQAIELLNQALSQMQVLSLRLPREMAEALETVGQETGRTSGSIIRQLIEAWLNPEEEEAAPEEVQGEAQAQEPVAAAEAVEESELQEEPAAAAEAAEVSEEEPAEATPIPEEGEAVSEEEMPREEVSAGLFGGTGKKKKR